MYTKAVRINPSPSNFLELTDIYLRVGQPSDALMAANAGLSKSPRDARLWNAKGMALNDLMRISDAKQAFERAVKLDPSFAVARRNLQAVNAGSIARH
jgi:Flp pilus assembly protein TadD